MIRRLAPIQSSDKLYSVIYLSSYCSRSDDIKESVNRLRHEGFRHIELTGGSKFSPSLEQDLLLLQRQHGIEYLCHNYFPPPENPFVLNLASLDNSIFNRTIEQLRRSILISKKLGAKRFGFHAGFFVDVHESRLGKKFPTLSLRDREASISQFCEGFSRLQRFSNGIDLYIENNVFSASNHDSFGGQNPFMLTSFKDLLELQQKISFRPLLDIGHLKVSTKTLGLNFDDELHSFMNRSDYLHLSDNDAKHDLNHCIQQESELARSLQNYDLYDKTITLEFYGSIDEIKRSYQCVKQLAESRRPSVAMLK